jgi:hypothetical protein
MNLVEFCLEKSMALSGTQAHSSCLLYIMRSLHSIHEVSTQWRDCASSPPPADFPSFFTYFIQSNIDQLKYQIYFGLYLIHISVLRPLYSLRSYIFCDLFNDAASIETIQDATERFGQIFGYESLIPNQEKIFILSYDRKHLIYEL